MLEKEQKDSETGVQRMKKRIVGDKTRASKTEIKLFRAFLNLMKTLAFTLSEIRELSRRVTSGT